MHMLTKFKDNFLWVFLAVYWELVVMFIIIILTDVLKAVYLELPWGAQVGKPTQVRASLFGDHLMDFGQVHFVWKFGDQVKDLLSFLTRLVVFLFYHYLPL